MLGGTVVVLVLAGATLLAVTPGPGIFYVLARTLWRQTRRRAFGIWHFHRGIDTRPGRWVRPVCRVGCISYGLLRGQVCRSTLPCLVGIPDDSDTKRADG